MSRVLNRNAAVKPNIERFALDAVAGNDEDIGLDTLRRLRSELHVLQIAVTSPDEPAPPDVVGDVIFQMICRIELALQLANADQAAEGPEAAE